MANKRFMPVSSGENFEEIDRMVKGDSFFQKFLKNKPALMLAVSAAAEFVAGLSNFDDRIFTEIVNSNMQLKLACQNAKFRAAFRKFLQDVFDEKKIKPRAPQPSQPTESATNGDVEEDEANFTLPSPGGGGTASPNLTNLIFAIPTAYVGDIITSEHHNSLRRAIYALASEIDPVVETKIYTFAPALLPFDESVNRIEALTNINEIEDITYWKVFYNKAVVPTDNERGGAGKKIRGGFLAQLPDSARVAGMIVRGKRLGEADDPKSFTVNFVRVRLNRPNLKPTVLIQIDLREETDFFEKKELIRTADAQIDNKIYQYFVTAEWEDEDDSARFEINSIQIVCV